MRVIRVGIDTKDAKMAMDYIDAAMRMRPDKIEIVTGKHVVTDRVMCALSEKAKLLTDLFGIETELIVVDSTKWLADNERSQMKHILRKGEREFENYVEFTAKDEV